VYAKLAAASVGLILAAIAAYAWVPSVPHISKSLGQDITLVPKTLDGAPMLKHWHNRQPGTVVEVGALYAAANFGPAPVLVDFRRGDPYSHNGIGCFLNKGESLTSETLHTFHTAFGSAVFDVGVLRTADQVRVIAATECTAKTCESKKLPFLSQLWHLWNKKHLTHESGSVVPLAVILTQKASHSEANSVTSRLEEELRRVIAVLDLKPARQLAAVQAGLPEPTGMPSNVNQKSKPDIAE